MEQMGLESQNKEGSGHEALGAEEMRENSKSS